VLAGLAIVREAGGWANDFLGNNGLVDGNPIVTCTPEIADRIKKALADGPGLLLD